MSKIFLDLGGNNGCSVRQFMQTKSDAKDWDIYSFEANPDLAKHFPVVHETFINKAVWTYDGDITFWKSNKTGSSTLLHEKVVRYTTQHWTEMKVECIDFHKWLVEHIEQEDYVIVKMDIEGAEYDIVDHIIEKGSIKLINEFWGEIHGKKIGKTEKDVYEWKLKLYNEGLTFQKWDAMNR